MKKLKTFAFCVALALFFWGCESMGSITEGLTTIGVFTGNISGSQKSALDKSAQAIQKSFEDITPEQEYYIGRAVAATVFSKYMAYKDAKANDYLNLLGTGLAYVSDRPETYKGYRFQVLDSEEINAFAAPGGLIMVSRGLLRCAKSEDEVAAILAHEIGHVVLEHGLKAIQNSRLTSALTSTALAAGQTLGPSELRELTATFGDSIGDITNKLITSGYSRDQESEADHQAVIILGRAGYDRMALVRMLELMKVKLAPGGVDFAKTHPDPEERIADVKGGLSDYTAPAAAPAARTARFQTALGKI
jgi:predicted Zn-dependent protease